MEREISLTTAKNNLALYINLYAEYDETIKMLEDMLANCNDSNIKRYHIIVDELTETTKSAHGIKQYIEFYENFIKEHENERNFDEIDKTGAIPETPNQDN